MKRRSLLLFFSLSGMCILLMSNSIGRALVGFGNTGAPGEGAGCFLAGCHVDENTFGNQTIIQFFEAGTTNEITTYDPGQTYDGLVSIITDQPAGAYGFQIVGLLQESLVDVAGFSNPGADVGIRVAVNTGRQYAEHTTASATNTFSFQWTAPPAGSGNVQFWASGNAVDGGGSPAGDDPDNATLILSESGTTSFRDIQELDAEIRILGNPVEIALNVEIESSETGMFDLELLDWNGRLLRTERIELTTGIHPFSVNVSTWRSGLYLFRIKKGHRFATATFLKF
ncbi:MAG: choice-of-anchor V domain-containing protein [Bacteroidota bacterium]